MEASAAAARQEEPIANASWDEAFVRVESYLRSYGLESRVLLNQATASIIDEARSRAAESGCENPVGIAMETTHARIGEWLAKSGQPVDWSSERTRAQGRLALVIADFPGRWSESFLDSGPFPEALSEAIASCQILPAPGMRLSNMAPEPLEFGLLEPGDPRLRSRRIWIPMRAMVPWLLIFGFFGVAWASSH
jgi:hypothetical protein